MSVQDNNTSNNQNPINKLGDYAVEGGPGRPKGLKNKFTLIKQDMLEVWEEENGKERFRELFKGPQKDFLRALDKIVAILPRDSNLDMEKEGSHQILLIRSSDQNEK